MAIIDYPSSLPSLYSAPPEEGMLETKVQDSGEVGAARRRNRFTRSLNRWKYTVLLTEDQKAVLYEFYQTTLVRGVHEFNWTHPTTGVVYEVTMVMRPKTTYVAPNLWGSEIELEEI